MDGRYLLEAAAGVALLWFLFSFHWTRILACGLGLTVWAGFVIVAPVYFAIRHLSDGQVFGAIVTLALAAVLGLFWWIGAKAALDWIQRRRREGRLWLSWDAR